MKPSIVVLTDFSPAAERALAYAAVLAGPLAAEVHVVNVYSPPPMTSRLAAVLYATNARYLRERRRTLEKAVADLPGPVTTELMEADWDTAVTEALARHEPMLLVVGLTATDGTLDEWLSNRPLPLARQTGYPLLLVPQHLPNAALHPPRCLALAVTDEPFALVPDAQRVAPLLDALGTAIVTVCVVPASKWATGEHGLRAARQCGLAAAMPASQLHTVATSVPSASSSGATRKAFGTSANASSATARARQRGGRRAALGRCWGTSSSGYPVWRARGIGRLLCHSSRVPSVAVRPATSSIGSYLANASATAVSQSDSIISVVVGPGRSATAISKVRRRSRM